MSQKSPLRFDQIGYWSEIKLDIVREYAHAYSTILSKQKLSHAYIDGFAGAGMHISRTTQDFVPGSPLNALLVQPPFRDYYFIDLDGKKVKTLRQMTAAMPNVHIYEGDCNEVLLHQVFPNVLFTQFRRALCLLDPYGLDLKWEVIAQAAQTRSIEIFLNFPVMDMNRNALWRKPRRVGTAAIGKMNAFWGDDSWKGVVYKPVPTLFGDEEEKVSNETVAEAFRERLVKVAGFKKVARPMPMRNSKGAVVYYLFFASQKPVAEKIVRGIFRKYGARGES
jgi:three-Cys-motif partner protein